MSSQKLKIEVFKFTLKHKPEKISDPTFRNLFSLKYSNNEDLEDRELMKKFNYDLSKRLDNGGAYIKSTPKSLKAFSILKTPISKADSHIVHGILKGGDIGDNKTSSSFKDKEKDESLNGKVINDKFFFLIYTPLESKVGFVIFQSYSQSNVRVDFMTFLKRSLFKHDKSYGSMDVESFVNDEFKEKYKKEAVLSQLTFSDSFTSTELSSNSALYEDPKEYEINIIIKPKGNKSWKLERIEKAVKGVQEVIFNNKTLGDFSKTKGKIKKEGKEITFELDGLNDIKPRIILGDDYMKDFNIPDFDKIKDFCFELLKKIKFEFYEKNKPVIIG